EYLERTDEPLTAQQLVKAAKIDASLSVASSILEALVAEGRCHRYETAKGKTKATSYSMRSLESLLKPRLLEYLRASAEPLTADQCRKGAKLDAPADLTESILEQLVASGQCRRFEPLKRKQSRYWVGDVDQLARGVTLAVLEKGKGKNRAPLSWTELS